MSLTAAAFAHFHRDLPLNNIFPALHLYVCVTYSNRCPENLEQKTKQTTFVQTTNKLDQNLACVCICDQGSQPFFAGKWSDSDAKSQAEESVFVSS